MNFQDLGTTGIIGVILVAFTVIGFFKGLIRTVLALACLGISGYTAFLGHQHADTLVGSWINNPQPWLSWSIAIIAGLIAFILCRFFLHFLINPFNSSNTIQRIGFGLPAAMITLGLGVAFLWLLFTGIRYGGSLAELEDTQYKLLNDKDPSSAADKDNKGLTPHLLSAKRALDASSVGKWQQLTDPFHSPEKIKLCKIVILYHHMPSRHRMLKTPEFNTLLNKSSFIDLAYNEEIKKIATSDHCRELFSAEPVTKILSDSECKMLLQKVNPDHFSSHNLD